FVDSPLEVAAQQHLRMAFRAEPMSGGGKPFANLAEVVNASVEDQPHSAVVREHGLAACVAQVDNRKAVMRQRHPRPGRYAVPVGPAPRQLRKHAPGQVRSAFRAAMTDESRDAAHLNFSLRLFASDARNTMVLYEKPRNTFNMFRGFRFNI